MDAPVHDLGELFSQLGLPSSPEEIEQFIATHRGLAPEVLLTEAPFWSPAQAQFLKEEWREDADWAPLVDQLNLRLR